MTRRNQDHHELDRYIDVNPKYFGKEMYLTKKSSITCDEKDFPLTVVIYMREKKPIDTTTMFIGLTEEGFPMSIAVPKTVNNWNDVIAGDVVTFDAVIRHSNGKNPVPRAYAVSHSSAKVIDGYSTPRFRLAIPDRLPQHGHEIFLTVDEILPRNTISSSKKAPWQVIGTVNDHKVYLKIFPTSTRQTLAAANVNIGDVIHASPVTISNECYMGVEKTSCYITWTSVLNIIYNQHRDPKVLVEGDDHAIPCENLEQIASKSKNTVIEITVVTLRDIKNCGTWITDMDGAKHISFNRCALNSIPMVKDNIMEVGTTIKLKALVVQITPDIRLGYISHSTELEIPIFKELANFNKYQPIISIVPQSDTPMTPVPDDSAIRKRNFLEDDYDDYFETTPKPCKKERIAIKPLDFTSPSKSPTINSQVSPPSKEKDPNQSKENVSPEDSEKYDEDSPVGSPHHTGGSPAWNESFKEYK